MFNRIKKTMRDRGARFLLNRLDSPHEEIRALAHMTAINAGLQLVPYLQEAINNKEHLGPALRVLADIEARTGEVISRGIIENHLNDEDPEVVSAAEDALAVLDLTEST